MTNINITSDMFENVNTHALKVGDFVSTHGVLFRLVTRDERHDADDVHTPCVWFTTEVVAEQPDSSIPKHWRKDWTIQGNALATWTRLDRKKLRAAL